MPLALREMAAEPWTPGPRPSNAPHTGPEPEHGRGRDRCPSPSPTSLRSVLGEVGALLDPLHPESETPRSNDEDYDEKVRSQAAESRPRLVFTRQFSAFDPQNVAAANSPFHGFYVLFWLAVALFVFKICADNWRQHGTPLGSSDIMKTMFRRDGELSPGLCLLCFALLTPEHSHRPALLRRHHVRLDRRYLADSEARLPCLSVLGQGRMDCSKRGQAI